MFFSKRRLTIGITFIISLLGALFVLRIALEWRQALHNIDAMIVTPVILPSPTIAPALSDDRQPSLSLGSQPIQPPASYEEAPLSPSLPSVPEQTHILLLGTDARLTDKEATRTDAMVLLRLDHTRDRVSMLSLPRDLWVSYPNDLGAGRINAAYPLGERTFGYGGGAALTKATVSRLLGLQVDYFVMIDFQGFKALIDHIGGITLDIPEAIFDPAYPTEDYKTIPIRFKAGKQQLTGERALIYARTRHADSDFQRNQRQQLVLMAMFDRIRQRQLFQHITDLDDYTSALRDYVRTDIPRSLMIELAAWGKGLEVDDVRRYAIDSSMIVELKKPATFTIYRRELKRLIGQFTGESVSSAGGE